MKEKPLSWEEFKELSMNQKRTQAEWESFIENKRLANDYFFLQNKYFQNQFSHDDEIKSLKDEIKLLQQKCNDGWNSRQKLACSLTSANNEIEYLKKKIVDLILEKMVLESRLDKRTIWQILRLKPINWNSMKEEDAYLAYRLVKNLDWLRGLKKEIKE